jgi:hypothetical protein
MVNALPQGNPAPVCEDFGFPTETVVEELVGTTCVIKVASTGQEFHVPDVLFKLISVFWGHCVTGNGADILHKSSG